MSPVGIVVALASVGIVGYVGYDFYKSYQAAHASPLAKAEAKAKQVGGSALQVADNGLSNLENLF